MKAVLYFIFVVIAIVCSSFVSYSKKGDNHICTNTQLDTLLVNKAKKHLEIIEIDISVDTLFIVQASRSVFYPFGKMKKITSLHRRFPLSQINIRKYSEEIDLITFSSNDHSLVFYKDQDYFEIVSGEISDKSLSLNNGVRIGMNFQDFLSHYFEGKVSDVLPEVKIVQVISAVDGLWHSYIFEKQMLKEIKFRSDYIF